MGNLGEWNIQPTQAAYLKLVNLQDEPVMEQV